MSTRFDSKEESGWDIRYRLGSLTEGIPAIQNFATNFDFSTFPLLVERVWVDLFVQDIGLYRRIPLCFFQHYCATLLNATLIDYKQSSDGARVYMNYPVPRVIGEYFSLITGTTTQMGEEVHLHIPCDAIPLADKHAGSFGKITAKRHNLYECYLAPLVTRRKVEATRDRKKDWTPLPAELIPAGLTATRNFLGYGPIEGTDPQIQLMLQNLDFPAENTADGSSAIERRLQFSRKIMTRVACELNLINEKYDIVSALVNKERVPGNIGFLEVVQNTPSTTNLCTVNAVTYSCNSMKASLANMIYIQGLRRRRREVAPGLCCLKEDGTNPDGWIASINSNFECRGPFSILRYRDDPFLRHKRFFAISTIGDRVLDIENYIRLITEIHKLRLTEMTENKTTQTDTEADAETSYSSTYICIFVFIAYCIGVIIK